MLRRFSNHDQVYVNEGSYCVLGHRSIPYYGKVLRVYQDGDYQILSVLGGAKRQKPNHVFASEAEAFNCLATGAVDVSGGDVVDVNGAGASYIATKAQLTVLIAEKAVLSSKLQRAKRAHTDVVKTKKQAVGRQKNKTKDSLHISNQKAVKLVNRLESELKRTKDLANAQSKKSIEIIKL